jgi:dihydroorotate dehydrogenase electron transfer subunit
MLTSAKIISNQEILPGIYLAWLAVPEMAAAAKPGQFVMVRCGTDNEMLLRRPISIHGRDKDKIALLYRCAGKGTEWLAGRGKDEALDLIGPLGTGFDISSRGPNLLFIAGGMGIAPLGFLAQEAVEHNFNVVLLIGAPHKNALFPKKLLSSKVRYIAATDDGSSGQRGFVTELIPSFIDRSDQVFACGPLPMYRTLRDNKDKLLKNKPVQISLEMRMACGNGVCYGCTVNTKRGWQQVCKHGPVFNLEDVILEEAAV